MSLGKAIEPLGLEFTKESDESDLQILPKAKAGEEAQAFHQMFYQRKKGWD